MTVGSQLKQTIAVIRGANATLRLYAAQTQKQEAREVYHQAVAVTDEVLRDLEDRLKALEFREPQYKGI